METTTTGRRGYGVWHRAQRRVPSTPFGATLRRLRDARNLTATDVGRLAGVHHTHVSRMENGQRSPSYLPVLARIAAAMDLSRDERIALVEAAGYPILAGGGDEEDARGQ